MVVIFKFFIMIIVVIIHPRLVWSSFSHFGLKENLLKTAYLAICLEPPADT